ncbi:MAG: hypothetical protein HYZ84_07680 [Candidatus Omnitrophica bacterium]|nr:hypothetical protein [Candidatus Omnitrophota bacterium]
MKAKKIGKAKAHPEKGMWGISEGTQWFIMNQRLVELRPDMKEAKAEYSRHVHTKPPSKKRQQERAEYQEQQNELKKQIAELVVQIYAEILKESFSYPVPLRKDRDADHWSDWRYCLYQGIIYQFDRPNYTDEEMLERI